MKILIDNGHGIETPGKRSPDGKLLEWQYTRDIARQVVMALDRDGYDAELLVPEDHDVPLERTEQRAWSPEMGTQQWAGVRRITPRVTRVNNTCAVLGAQNVVLVSIHLNAMGNDSQWHGGHGWSVFVSANASAKSKHLCSLLAEEAAIATHRIVRRPQPGYDYWIQSLAITRDTNCPAVLTENFFMDNLDDYKYLLSARGRREVVALHVNALKRYVNELEGEPPLL